VKNSDLKFFVIGDPIDHSLSPLMQNFFLEKFRINGTYAAKQVRTEELDRTIKAFIHDGINGVNVTTPHKKAILKYINELTAEAKNIGSVNTIKIENNKLSGHNTDAIGFQASLQILKLSFKNKNAIIFGAGGAARAIVFALIREKLNSIFICNRNFEKAEKLVQDFSRLFPEIEFAAIHLNSEEICRILKSSQLLVNATTVGMGNVSENSILPDTSYLHKDLLVYDLVYRPYKTKLIQQAESCDVPWINGLDMLILQGIESLKFWMGQNLLLDSASYALIKQKLRREICQE
jgi:shikimate dehydrogenase